MNPLLSKSLFLSALLGVGVLQAQENPNLIAPALVRIEASSARINAPAKRAIDYRLPLAWESQSEREGAWLQVEWAEPCSVQELWIVNTPPAHDLLLDPEMRDQIFPAARRVRFDFADGSSHETELRQAEYAQIVRLPTPASTDRIRLTIEQVWDNAEGPGTGLSKIDAYGRVHDPAFRVDFFEMYDMRNGRPVQSAKIEIINPGDVIAESSLQIRYNGKSFASLPLEEIPARSVTRQQLWVPAIYEPGTMHFEIRHKGRPVFATLELPVKPYQKDYFDGGDFYILSTNHNDLGWLYTQPLTADYRSYELIGPALDLMRDHPEYKYNMESVEYLKEFLVRCPDRRDEITQRMREGRFEFGASYTQNLPAHVGREKLVRHFYHGRRWLIENFPGCDARYYSNVDVPGMTQQFPQILRKCGVDYIVQGRFPWGFYYWQGIDGSLIPMFALRYTGSSRLLNPVNNTGWLSFQRIREPYYRSQNLPKELIYDFNCDYLPPAPKMIPFVRKQNEAMLAFARVWNDHFKELPNRWITPSTLRFATPTETLDRFFGKDTPQVQTIRGDWPMSWAYFDEPGHREGLLAGRRGHNALLQAEKLWAWLGTIAPTVEIPRERFEQGWLANCWPDHGWGGNCGPTADSLSATSYLTSLAIGSELAREGTSALAARLPRGHEGQLPLLVYNGSGWQRDDIVTGAFSYPANWDGLAIVDVDGGHVPYELIYHDPATCRIEIAFNATEIPALGYRIYYAQVGPAFSGTPVVIEADSLENSFLKVRFGAAGITSLYDKVAKREVLNTEKFAGGEVIQLTAATQAWETLQEVTTEHFDRTAHHGLTITRATESPVRYTVEATARFPDFILHERFILPKNDGELIVEAEVVDWEGIPERELRILFPMNQEPTARISYGVPFSTVEVGRDEADFSYLPENIESNFKQELYDRQNLPFREALDWVDVSSGKHRGSGCLLASDITLHVFRDETDNPVDYPVVQHVMLSSRKSISWNPENWFVQPGNHHYRMSLRPHEGNWRYAYRNGETFNNPLVLCPSPVESVENTGEELPACGSFFQIGPANLIVSAVKPAEDGDGVIVRFFEAEGNLSQLNLSGGLSPLRKAWLTDMLEYNRQELTLQPDGSVILEVKPWEIVTLRLHF